MSARYRTRSGSDGIPTLELSYDPVATAPGSVTLLTQVKINSGSACLSFDSFGGDFFLLVQRRMHRMPRERRALYPDGKLAYAGEDCQAAVVRGNAV